MLASSVVESLRPMGRILRLPHVCGERTSGGSSLEPPVFTPRVRGEYKQIQGKTRCAGHTGGRARLLAAKRDGDLGGVGAGVWGGL